MRAEFETTDAQETWALMQQAFGVDVQVTTEPGPVHLVREDLGTLVVDEVEHHVGLAGTALPTGFLKIVEGRRGWADVTRREGTDRVAPGVVLGLAQPGEEWSVRSGPVVHERVVSLDEAALRQAVRDRSDADSDGTVRFATLVPAPASSAPWTSLADFVARTAAAHPEVLRQQLALSSLTQLAAHTALAVFANDTWGDPSQAQLARDSMDSGSGAVVRAVAYIETSAHTDITVADIAEAAHVTPRALQYGFRRQLGTTPMSYLRKVRLHHARAELLAADPATTVAGVAGRWGFFNLGRFASYYRAEFGENPAHTLSVVTGQRSSDSSPS
ncbi:AraC family transcriptional regulator [Nocardioides anomalus]|uniref:AraC family transcriptional regulator n=1 Tax=Nocardioides anomalus TaxID=2712223 RepID=A0A6G6W9T1_9ACTN|nr:helix-turn-helix domain-containing protein [Nocardioides anomalus]QIG42111.1 AraC family transcriptional regulator [Nocardioides anomalus]